ncbi:MAG: Cof-type HAD-IIB family hydrolase [Mycoplasmatales bacterium]|nr:Cof-type HAD-IIB family hydrolase [Mycoplasmatales bacterium]
MKNKWLFTVDLDGTLLKNSSTGEINPKDKKAIHKLIEAGHIVTIVTGRPWRSTEKTYNALGLKTIVGNYNGAQIHNPSDYSFIPMTSYMNLNDVMYILGDKKIKAAMSNLAIEGPGWVMLEKRNKELERVFGFQNAAKLKVGINFHKLPLKPTGIIFDTKKGVNIPKLRDYLQRKYGDLVEFSSWSKGEGCTPVFDMTNVGVTKAKALSLMARYYSVPLKRTVAIGDGYNDVPMFETAEISVSMKNSSDDIKEKTTYTTEKSNKDGGVAEFINKFLADKDKKFISKLKRIRAKKYNIIEQTTKAH